jgi:hypothetical protein
MAQHKKIFAPVFLKSGFFPLCPPGQPLADAKTR